MYLLITQKWWMLIIRGLLALFIGGIALLWPIHTIHAVFLLLGLFLIIDSILQGSAAWVHRKEEPRWGTIILESILGFVIGVLALIWPLSIAMVLVYILAFWALFTGAMRIAGGLRLRRMIDHEWLLILSGVLSAILGIVLILLPILGLIALIWVFGIYMVLFGIFQMILGRRLRRIRLGSDYEISVTEYLSL